MKQFKRLLESSETFRKIVKEEASRIKRILKEYNESEIWNKLPSSVRRLALLTADAELGPDFADEYENEDNWMSLPDVVTNRINISDFDIPDNIDRGLLYKFIEQNRDKLPTGPWYYGSTGHGMTTDRLLEYMMSGANIHSWIIKNIIGWLKLTGKFPDIDYSELVQKPNNTAWTPIEGGTTPSKNRDWRGGYWTGD